MNDKWKSFIVGYGLSLALIMLTSLIQDGYEKKLADNPEQLSQRFEEKIDNNNNCIWVKPNGRPEYINSNGIWTYFWLKDGKPSNFRFVFQYDGDEWLHVKRMSFTCKSNNKEWTFVPSAMKRDCALTRKIILHRDFWEWCDEPATSNKWAEFMSWIDNSKNITVHVYGNKGKTDFRLTSKSHKMLKDTYHYYISLGGKL